MQYNQLQLYSEFWLYGKKHKIVSIHPPNVWIKRVEGDGEDFQIEFLSLVTHSTFKAGNAMKKEKRREANKQLSILESLSEEKREAVSQRVTLIQPLLLLEQIKEDNYRAIVQFMSRYNHYLKDTESVKDLTQEQLI
jgi:putative transposase